MMQHGFFVLLDHSLRARRIGPMRGDEYRVRQNVVQQELELLHGPKKVRPFIYIGSFVVAHKNDPTFSLNDHHQAATNEEACCEDRLRYGQQAVLLAEPLPKVSQYQDMKKDHHHYLHQSG